MRVAPLVTALLIFLAPAVLTKPSAPPNPPQISKTDLRCLAENIYHEARGEPFVGQLMVGKVTINRKKSGKFPNTICGVVYQRKQFSWTNSKPKAIRDRSAWHIANVAAYTALTDSRNTPALYFHTVKVNPNWGRPYLTRIGNHIFYS